jgi:gamma-D-glutamyl-L-lysine dipeptidyl-peptidase
MMYGSCTVAVAALTRQAAYSAEMVSQLVYGEKCTIIEEANGKWYHVRCQYDDYEGYAMKSQVRLIDEAVYLRNDVWQTITIAALLNSAPPVWLPAGACLHEGNRSDYSGSMVNVANNPPTPDAITTAAMHWLEVPYLWGGKTGFGADCSGFTQTLFRQFGVALPRDAWQQAAAGAPVGFLQEARAGDLAFFDDAEGKIIHVGVLLGPDWIIHAAGKVHIDPIDNHGIVNSVTKERTHTLRLIKRFF